MTDIVSRLQSAASGLVRTAYETAFTVSPIILTGGIAGSASGSAIPIITLTEAANSLLNAANNASRIVSGNLLPNLDSALCEYSVISGGKVVSQIVGMYPFANQQQAANATVMQPKHISIKMICAPKTNFGYTLRSAVLNNLWMTLEKHNNSGGLYTILTPSYIATNWILTDVTDITNPSVGEAPQSIWQFDFVKPLITESDAQSVQNATMSKLTAQTSFGSGELLWSNPISTLGASSMVGALGLTL